MNFQQRSISLILISFAILGCINTQRITIPLKRSDMDSLAISVQYGANQCNIEVYPSISCSDNMIQGFAQQAENCGAKLVEGAKYLYTAPFQLGDTQATLSYTISSGYGSSYLCLGNQGTGQNNTLIQLFQSGKITQKRVYYSLNVSKSQDGSIGEVNIGNPNQSLLKKGAKIVELVGIQGSKSYTATSSGSLEFFGKQLLTQYTIQFSENYVYYIVPRTLFDAIITIFQVQGIQYEQDSYVKGQILLPSIEKLQPIKLSLLQKDNTSFPIIIKPSQYTRPQGNKHQLLLQPVSGYDNQISLSFKMFESYYVGYNLEGLNILIAEKPEQQANNFRGSSHISE